MVNKNGKHPLKESLLSNGPPPKRSRFEEVIEQLEDFNPAALFRSNNNNRPRRRGRIRSEPQEIHLEGQDQQVEQSFQSVRRGGSKRRKGVGSAQILETTTDENDITELTRQFKRARLRPVFFTISSFIEQTVDDVQVTVGDEDDNNNSDSGITVSSTFTFVLPSPTTGRRTTSIPLFTTLETYENDTDSNSQPSNDNFTQVN